MNKFKSIIITGTSSGLGAEIAKQFTTKNKNTLYYPISRFKNIDVGNYKQVQEFFSLIDSYGIEDNFPVALINNAGVCKKGNILEMSIDDWNEQINTNINGIHNCSKEYVKLCLKYNFKGKIINIASTAGNSIRPGRAGYAATKTFVINYSLSLAEELKLYGIKVFCISPSAFDSKLRREIAPDDNFEQMIKVNEIADFIIKIINDGQYLDNQNIIIKK